MKLTYKDYQIIYMAITLLEDYVNKRDNIINKDIDNLRNKIIKIMFELRKEENI